MISHTIIMSHNFAVAIEVLIIDFEISNLLINLFGLGRAHEFFP